MSDERRPTPTMYDVAALAGVSHQTVSRVLNGFTSIRPQTRDRVLAAIADLGYRRNTAARSLATRRTGAIGVLAPAVNDYGPTTIVQAIEFAARAEGYHPLVTTAGADSASILASLGFLLDQAVEALVVIAPQREVLEAMRQLDVSLPIATLQSTALGRGIVVSIDQEAGAEAAMDHLVELGHRRIQHIAGPLAYFEAAVRRDVYAGALQRAGLQPRAVIEGDWSAESGYRAAEHIEADTTAVFAGNDQMALGVISGLAARGRAVPRQVSVVGFDDVPEARFYSPALTTVRQDFAGVGRLAVESLIRQIESGEVNQLPLVASELIVRASTAHHPG